MKLPQPAPSWDTFVPKLQLDKMLISPAFREAMKKACGEHYPYWDDLKYIDLPTDIPPEWLWTWREFSAALQRKRLPLKAATGAEFSFWLPDKAQEFLHYIEQRSAGLVLSDGRLFHSRERYIARSLTEEAIASSQIEGAATTREAARAMLRSGRKPTDRSERMIANNYRAMEFVRDRKDDPLSRELLLGLQTVLTEGTLDDPQSAGRFRRSPDDDNIVVEDTDDGVILHKPPRGAELEASIDKLVAYANQSDESPFIHPVVKAIILHFWLGFAHPFVDGNGRTARALFYWYLLKRGHWLFEYVSISQMVYSSYRQYLKAYLYSEAGGDLTYFVMYNLRVIKLAIVDLHKYIERTGAELQRANELLRRLPELNHRQRELLIHALKNPGEQYSIKQHEAIHQITYQTARTDLLGLVKTGFLLQSKVGRLFVFLPTAKIPRVLGVGT